jgi:transcriptional regulator with XRE-family HTH domain
MAKHRVTLEELAARLDLTPVYVGEIRRGDRRPHDKLKVEIAAITLQMEADFEIEEAARRGVPVLDWFEPETLAKAKRVGGGGTRRRP